MNAVLHFALSAIIYIAFDLAFLGIFAKKFIQNQVGFLLAPKPNWAAAVIFYFLFTAGILYFCVAPAIAQASVKKAVCNGAFLGLVCYGTYELVNLSLINRWPLALVVVDILWGVVVGAAVSWASYGLWQKFFISHTGNPHFY